MNILITMAYVGTNYHGFQVQKNAVGVCAVLQNAMEKVLGCRPDVKGCSRTDAGVHARQYCVSFHSNTQIPLRKLPLAFNRYLPADIRVKTAQQVPEHFHARYHAAGKEYEYIFLNTAIDNPFFEGRYYRVPYALDVQAMHKAGQHWVGKHNFASFMSAGSDIEDTVRTVQGVSVARSGEQVVFTVSADGFLYNMVRIMAGTLLWVGSGRITQEQAKTILESKNRAAAGETMPAKGLFLNKVFYNEEDTRFVPCK